MIKQAPNSRPRPRLVTDEPADTASDLKSYIDRIIRLHEERKGLSNDIADILAEAKSRGYDRKGLVGTVKRLMGDEAALTELDGIIDLYLCRYREVGTVDASHTGAGAHRLGEV